MSILPAWQNEGMTRGRPRTVPPSQENLVLRLRQERGWTVQHLARLADLSPAHVQKIETGRRNLTQKALRSLADAFGLPTRDLLPGAPETRETAAMARLARLTRGMTPEQIEALVGVGELMVRPAAAPARPVRRETA